VRISLEATLLESFSIFISKVNTMLILGLIVQGIVYLVLSLFTKFFLVRSHQKLA
jgi:ABC-type multidrug transport system permease subunit